MLPSAHNKTVNPALLSMSNKASFHISGFVNAWSTCHYAENPQTMHEAPLHSQNMMCGA
jgi:hypothetical protein